MQANRITKSTLLLAILFVSLAGASRVDADCRQPTNPTDTQLCPVQERLSGQRMAGARWSRLPPERALRLAREDLSYQSTCRRCPAPFWVMRATPHLGQTHPQCWNLDPTLLSAGEATELSLIERVSLAASGNCTAWPASGMKPRSVCDGMHTGELVAGTRFTEPTAELRVTGPTGVRLSFKPEEIKRLAAFSLGSGLLCTGLGSTSIKTNTPIDPLAFDTLLRAFLGNRVPVPFFMRIRSESGPGVRDGAVVWFNRATRARSDAPDSPIEVEVDLGHIRSGFSENCKRPIQNLLLRIDQRPKNEDPCDSVVSIVKFRYSLVRSRDNQWVSGSWSGRPPIKVWLATLPENEKTDPSLGQEAAPTDAERERAFAALRSLVSSWAVMAAQRTPGEEDDRDGQATEQPQPSIVGVGDERRFFCSGALIHPRAVLTARHCLPATRVAFGEDTARPDAVVAVSDSRVPADRRLDAALLILREPQPQRAHLRWRPAAERSPPTGEVLLLGYGAQPPQSYGRLRAMEVPVEGWGCDELRAQSTGCEPGLEMVLPRLRGFDTCRGDSGGPVVEQAQGEPRVLAITSRPIAQFRLPCGDGGVYVRTDVLAPWLDSEIQRLESPLFSVHKENLR